LENQEIVAELVHGFLIPETQKQLSRQQVKNKQKPFLQAAHKTIYKATEDLPNDQSNKQQ
jgi:hypothetical protein